LKTYKNSDIAVHKVEEAHYEGEMLLSYDSCLTGDDADASEVEHTHTSGRCSISASYSGWYNL